MDGALKVLDLFSGIGGFSLGLERAGMRTVAFCEIEPYCRAVLKKHWPNVPCYDDVRTLTADRLRADGIVPDVICGGFPCQDISVAGKQAGIDGERSGLWSEYARIIGEFRPLFVIVENVAALAFRGLDRVLGDLAAIGYDAEWHCIPASAVGARHRRDRLWIVAYPRSARLEGLWCPFGISASQPFLGVGRALANTDSGRCRGSDGGEVQQPRGAEAVSASETMADATRERRGEARRYSKRPTQRPSGSGAALADAECWGLSAWDEQYDKGHPIFFTERSSERGWDQVGETWRVEPDLGRVAYGVPNAMDRIKSLGNAVVPQIPEIIGRAILQAEGIAA